jgi:hypothetical protein
MILQASMAPAWMHVVLILAVRLGILILDRAHPMCFLKNCRPEGRVAYGTVGGMKFLATMSGDETDIDRVGCDYKILANSYAQLCLIACALDSRCQAWNFDPRSSTPKCFLKNCVPAPTVFGGMVSGVKFSE